MMKGGGDGSSSPATESEQAQAQTLMRIAYQNIAMCYVKLKDGARALENCKRGLSYDDGTMWKVYRTKRTHICFRGILTRQGPHSTKFQPYWRKTQGFLRRVIK